MALLSPCGHCGNQHDSSIACSYPTPPAALTLEEQIAAGVEKALAGRGKKTKSQPVAADSPDDPNAAN